MAAHTPTIAERAQAHSTESASTLPVNVGSAFGAEQRILDAGGVTAGVATPRVSLHRRPNGFANRGQGGNALGGPPVWSGRLVADFGDETSRTTRMPRSRVRRSPIDEHTAR